MMHEAGDTGDIRRYLRILWRWKFLFLFFVLAAPVGAYLIERAQPTLYRSTALVNGSAGTVAVPGGVSTTASNVAAVAALVTTTPVADIAAGLLHPTADPSSIASEVSASGDVSTGFIRITAEDRNPDRAAAIANAFARAIGDDQQANSIESLRSQIKVARAQLRQLGPRDANRVSLQQTLSQLRGTLTAQEGGAGASWILQAATPSGTPVGSPRRSAELGLLIGLLLGLGAVTVAENADRRLRTPDDLQGMTGLPLLTCIPPSAFSDKLETSKQDHEAFDILRTGLMFFNLDRRLKSVLVTSPGEKDGKTTVAAGLALATARAGLHVILLDGDLRRAQAAPRLGVPNEVGLGAVLADQHPLSEALVEYALDAPGSGRLTVLPAGPPPPNPAALTSSQAMQRVVRDLESRSDLLIIDTPAALAVGDPRALMPLVSGVVLVARMNRSTRHSVQELQKIVQAAHGTPLGVAATGVRPGPGYHYYYGEKDHSSSRNGTNGSGPSGRLRLRRRSELVDGSGKR